MKSYFLNVLFLHLPILIYSQVSPSYSLDAELKIESKIIHINQKISIKNNQKLVLDTLFFNDWSNSYSDSKSPLAQKLAEEFNRSFYLSSKKNRGNTKIETFQIKNNPIKWDRLKNQIDIIFVVLDDPLIFSDSLSINIKYSIKIPNKQFTGIGFQKDLINIQDFIISLSPFYDGKWIINSNLNLNDNSLIKAPHKIKWTYPKNLHLLSSMNKLSSYSKENIKIAYYESKYERSPKFIFSKENLIREFNIKKTKISTDIFKRSDEFTEIKIKKIYDFLSDNFKSKNIKNSYLITSYDYDQRPINGLNIFPEIISPFESTFIEEIKFLKIFTSEFIKSQLNDFNFRENNWMSEGLTVFMIMKYIDLYYPDQKLIGKLSNFPILNKYSLSDRYFNEIFMINSEIMLRRNLHQAAITSKDNLIKYNERISIPYQVGLLFRYLEDYIGEDSFKSVLNQIGTINNIYDFNTIVEKNTDKKDSKKIIQYLKIKPTLDIKINKIVKNQNNTISVFTNQASNQNIPYKIALLNNNVIIDSKWVSSNSNSPTLFKTNTNANYFAINPIIGLPETNKQNNWRSLNSNIFGKPLSIKFFKDSEDPTKNQILINPTAFYNLYDGASFGARFHNKTIPRRPLVFMIEPSYSTIEKTLVGSVITDYRIYDDSKSNYLTQFSFFGSSFHYAPNSLYKIAVPSLKFYFRPSNLRNNLRQGLSFSWYSIQRESLMLNNSIPNYSLGEIKYEISNKGSVNYFTFENSIEIAREFKKLILEIEYRKLIKSGRLFSSRLFFGSFIQNKINNNQYFNFNLNKPNDYLFEYAYFGRSETEGIFSQQFIMNEGGFKSSISNSSSNQWILSSNLSMGIWKWFEGYVDLAILKNKNQTHRSYYDYGFRFNFIPDYLEFYFPIGSSEEYEIVKENYFSRIRFVLSLNPKDISTFFSRTWF